MKSKPDIRAAQREEFLRGGLAAAVEAPPAPAPAPERITKTIRIDRALDLAVKRAALDQQHAAGGARVTESDLIDAALRQYLKV
jgi:hypothetical protein